MNSKMLVTQVKRELWENRVSFINTPVIISLLVITLALSVNILLTNYAHGDAKDFHFSFGSSSSDDSQSQNPAPPDLANPLKTDLKKFNIITSVASDPAAFNGFILGIMYSNCVLLFLVFSVVLGVYALRCLFDDRKNKDILFWRSMPVSETTNVLVKLVMVLVIAPVIILILNVAVTLIAFLISLIFLAFHDIGVGYLVSSVVKGGALYIPFQILFELIFSLLMLMPVIGFAFFASAFAKKTPFFTFASPLILLAVDQILHVAFGIRTGIFDLLAVYGRAISNTRAAFVLQESFTFQSSMILPLVICIGIGAAFIAGAIWLRNNRYEI
ncbi:MAG: hypothetical protein EOO52_05060 [Gammaproteobacteria bacterium]|nr:MAG: hypothetical protein EOO52_05060 [Gammaproteobacteria bacterium]